MNHSNKPKPQLLKEIKQLRDELAAVRLAEKNVQQNFVKVKNGFLWRCAVLTTDCEIGILQLMKLIIPRIGKVCLAMARMNLIAL